ncbi:MAG: hypothetical protein ACAI35_02290, partial [Candidatus Methylacidiphilales bacterium]
MPLPLPFSPNPPLPPPPSQCCRQSHALSPRRRRNLRARRGVALIVVLAFVVLLTGLVLVYFSRTATDRQLSNSSLNQAKADELARSSLVIITSQLRQEIASPTASTARTTGNFTIYAPATNTARLPIRNGAPPPTGSVYPIPNLVRISTPTAIAAPGVDYRASSLSTTTPSVNGRSISPARWNRHYLIPRDPTAYSGANASKVGTEPVPSFTAPAWIFVTREGPASTPIAAPSPAVTGRYAYAVYDEGGLLDMNVAGYPSALPASSPAAAPDTANVTSYGYSAKGSTAFADLTTLGLTQTHIDNLVAWRNYSSVQPAGALGSFAVDAAGASRYFHSVYGNTNGFTRVNGATWNGRTDQAFLSRQALLDLTRSLGIPQSALQYMGTFSRSLNAP